MPMRRAGLGPLWTILLVLTACQSAAYGPWPRHTPPGTQREYACRYTAHPPVLDGHLDDPAWMGAPWSEPFADAVDPEGPRPPQETWFKLLWDERHLYVAALLMETDVRATVERADAAAWPDSDFEVFIDPGTGGQAWFTVRANARGVLRGTVERRVDGAIEPRPWSCATLDGGLHVDGTLNDASDTDRAWMIELAIPWSCLELTSADARGGVNESGLEPVVGDVRRMNFLRRRNASASTEPAVEPSLWSWTPTWSPDPRDPADWGRVRFTR
jgi:hypothetical protein